MTNIDIEAVRAEYYEAASHIEEHWACCRGHQLARNLPVLLAEVEQWRDTYGENAPRDVQKILTERGDLRAKNAKLQVIADAAVALVVAIGRSASENPEHTDAEEGALIDAVAAAGLLPVVEAREVDADVVRALREAGEDHVAAIEQEADQ